MSSNSWYRSKKLNYSNSNSAFKWTSQSSSKKISISPAAKRSIPSSSNFSWKSSNSHQSIASKKVRESPIFRPKSMTIKIVDDPMKRLGNFPPSNGNRKSWSSSKRTVTIKDDDIDDGGVQFRTDSGILTKTIATPSISLKSSSPVASMANHGRKKIASRYKLVRNSITITPSNKQRKISPPSTTNSRSVTKLISKYKIRRRTSSLSSLTSKSIRSPWKSMSKNNGLFSTKSPSTCRQIGHHHRGGSIVNRFKIVRKPSSSAKKVYKIDRRQKATKSRAKLFNTPSKFRIRRNVSSANTWKAKIDGQSSQLRLCLFYIRYGRCCRGSSCKLIHDPSKIAVCTRFLRGTCKIQDCPFSHVVSADKMPLCRFYLLGNCNRSDCPYLHVNHGKTAKNCVDFERGYCPKGAKCDKKHMSRQTTKPTPSIESSSERVDQSPSLSIDTGYKPKLRSSIAGSLRQHLASVPKRPVVVDLSSGPLPEFIPLVKE